MDRRECLIYLKGKEKTPDIENMQQTEDGRFFSVKFKNSPTTFTYKSKDTSILKPKRVQLSKDCMKLYVKGKSVSGSCEIYFYEDVGLYYLMFDADHSYLLPESSVSIHRSVLSEKKSKSVFEYLEAIASLNTLKDENGTRILKQRYEKIDFVDERTVLASYLKGRVQETRKENASLIYPFGVNKSQMRAVENAFTSQMSIIEGPPGTGKTQTILTLIANFILNGKTAEVISNNNSAVENVKEKLEGMNLSFFLAFLGKKDNKEEFVAKQTGTYPDMRGWKLEKSMRKTIENDIKSLTDKLKEGFEKEEELARTKEEERNIRLEYRHFEEIMTSSRLDFSESDKRKNIPSKRLLALRNKYIDKGKGKLKLSLLERILAVHFERSMSKRIASMPIQDIETFLSTCFYKQKIEELTKKAFDLEKSIEDMHLDENKRKLNELSMSLLKAVLFEKYSERQKRPVFTEDDFWKHPERIIDEYPIVASTAFSSSTTIKDMIYDFVIIDEASQSDIATGALAMKAAKNAIIVGDSKQLENVVTQENAIKAAEVFVSYDIHQAYEYNSNSFLSSVSKLFPSIPRTMLKEHYRCDPDIIGFSNERFYDSQLVIMTKEQTETPSLSLFLAVEGNHSRDHMNLRQDEIIKNEVLPTLKTEDKDIGIITPYKNNVLKLKEMLDPAITISTIHSFQGRELDTIIFATSDDTVTDFSDDSALINVAITRAKKHFILVATDNKMPKGSNTEALIDYIRYHSKTIVHSNINSVFDLLYKSAAEERERYLGDKKQISEFDSENLMYSLIIKQLEEHKEQDLDVVPHYPLRYLFNPESSIFSTEESSYMRKDGTHVDFLIYKRIGKVPKLAIEVDGWHYHKKGSRQSERDQIKDSIFTKSGFPLIRFATNGSGEKEILENALENM